MSLKTLNRPKSDYHRLRAFFIFIQMNNALKTTNNSLSVQEISAVSKTFFESSMFSDCKSAAQAMVKIMAGAEVGLPAFQSMSGIHIIAGKPVMGAGLIATKIKGSGKYDYRVTEQSNEKCSIDFYQGKEKIGTSEFTLEDAKKAQTKNIDKFPKNMLFARAISNGVKWYCPDVFAGPIYVPGEIMDDNQQTEDVPFEDLGQQKDNRPTMVVGDKNFVALIKKIKAGTGTIEQAKEAIIIGPEVEKELNYALEQAA